MGLENRYRRCMPNRKRPPEAGGMQIATPASGSALADPPMRLLGEHLLAVATEAVVARIAPPVPASLRGFQCGVSDLTG
jgi:hypothetical protein